MLDCGPKTLLDFPKNKKFLEGKKPETFSRTGIFILVHNLATKMLQ